MNPFTFQTTPNVLFEPGAVRKLAPVVSGLGASRVMLVTDRGVREAGLTRDAEAGLAQAGIALTVFEDVAADPPSHVVEVAVARAREAGVEMVLAIGGGSALDTAKLVAYLARNDESLDAIYGVGLATGRAAAARPRPDDGRTGSEVTPIAIVTTPSSEKKGVVSPRLLPDWAVLDPELTLGLPPAVTAATGIDAMVHAIEAYTSRHTARTPCPTSSPGRPSHCWPGASGRPAATVAISTPARTCSSARCSPAWRSRTRRSRRSTRSPTHRRALPRAAWAVERPRAHRRRPVQSSTGPEPLRRAGLDPRPGRSRSCPDEAATRFLKALESLCRDCEVPASLAEVGITAGDLDRLAEDAMKQTRLLVNNPREVTMTMPDRSMRGFVIKTGMIL